MQGVALRVEHGSACFHEGDEGWLASAHDRHIVLPYLDDFMFWFLTAAGAKMIDELLVVSACSVTRTRVLGAFPVIQHLGFVIDTAAMRLLPVLSALCVSGKRLN